MGRRSPTSGSTSCSPTTASRSAATTSRRRGGYRPHLLTEPEERILAEKRSPVAARGRGCSTSSPRRSRSTSTASTGRASSRGSSLLAIAGPRACAAPRPRRSPPGSSPGCAPARSCSTRCSPTRRPTTGSARYPDWIASRNLGQRGERRVGAGARRRGAGAATTSRSAGTRSRPQLLGARPARRLRPHGVGRRRRAPSSAGTRPAQLVLDAYGSFSPRARRRRRAVLRRALDRRARCGRASARARSARTRCRRSTRTCCSTGRRAAATCSPSPTSSATACTPTWPASRASSTRRTPLTLAETASVFGETVTFGRLLDATDDPAARLALLAESLEGQIATVFRQIAMNRFEDAVHTDAPRAGRAERRATSTSCWAETQAAMLGDSVELTEGYRTWWSYIPHFIGTPGYVYAYAYGQLLALSVYRAVRGAGRRLRPRSTSSCSRRGGSLPPEELGRIVGVDLADPAFWDGGLQIVEQQLDAAEAAARRRPAACRRRDPRARPRRERVELARGCRGAVGRVEDLGAAVGLELVEAGSQVLRRTGPGEGGEHSPESSCRSRALTRDQGPRASRGGGLHGHLLELGAPARTARRARRPTSGRTSYMAWYTTVSPRHRPPRAPSPTPGPHRVEHRPPGEHRAPRRARVAGARRCMIPSSSSGVPRSLRTVGARSRIGTSTGASRSSWPPAGIMPTLDPSTSTGSPRSSARSAAT